MKEIAEEDDNGYVVFIYLIIHILSKGVREGRADSQVNDDVNVFSPSRILLHWGGGQGLKFYRCYRIRLCKKRKAYKKLGKIKGKLFW